MWKVGVSLQAHLAELTSKRITCVKRMLEECLVFDYDKGERVDFQLLFLERIWFVINHEDNTYAKNSSVPLRNLSPFLVSWLFMTQEYIFLGDR